MPVTATARSARLRASAPGRHLGRRGLADRAVGGERLRAHAEHLRLGAVRVGDESALEPGRAAGDVGDRAGDEPAGARLGGGDGRAMPQQRRAQLRRERQGSRRSFAFSGPAAVMVRVRRREAELAVHRDGRRIVRRHLQVCRACALLPAPTPAARRRPASRSPCRAQPARSRRRRCLPGRRRSRSAPRTRCRRRRAARSSASRAANCTSRSRCASRCAVRRSAQVAHDVDEPARVDVGQRDRPSRARERRARPPAASPCTSVCSNDCVAARGQRRFEIAGAHERRDPEQRRQLVLRIHRFAVRDLGGERQRGAEMRIDAARALRLAGRQAQQPAVVEELPLRLQRVEAGLLDPRRVDAARAGFVRRVIYEPDTRCQTANTSSV